MPTVAHVVSTLVSKQPFLEEALLQNILSYSRVALWMKPAVERELGKQVRDSAIVMALHRMAEGAREHEMKTTRTFKGGEITLSVRSEIMEFTVLKSPGIMSKLAAFYDVVDLLKGDVFNVTQGNYEVGVLVSKRYKQEIEERFFGEKIVSVKEDLALLSIKFPETLVETPGFISQVSRQLAWHNINVIELVSTFTELTLALEEKDVMRAYNSLQELFRRETRLEMEKPLTPRKR